MDNTARTMDRTTRRQTSKSKGTSSTLFLTLDTRLLSGTPRITRLYSTEIVQSRSTTIASLTEVSTALTEVHGQQTTCKLGLSTPSKWLLTTLLAEKDVTMPAMRLLTGRTTALYAEAMVWLLTSTRFKSPILM
jgi:hypothetical protein